MEALRWDEKLTDHLKTNWNKWFEELGQLDVIRVLRCPKKDK